MAAESVGMSQKKKDRAATIGMIIFFSILAILTVLPIYLLVLASFKPGNFLLQYGLNLNLDIPHLTLDNYKLLFTGRTVRIARMEKNMIIPMVAALSFFFWLIPTDSAAI